MHVKILNYATPQGQEEFIQRVQFIKIPHEGLLRSGYVRPVLSEWRLYDVRIPEDKQTEFAEAVGFHSISVSNKLHKENIVSNGRMLRWLIKLFRFALRMKTIEVTRTDVNMQTKNWRYTFLVGTIKDPKQKTVVGGHEREVL